LLTALFVAAQVAAPPVADGAFSALPVAAEQSWRSGPPLRDFSWIGAASRQRATLYWQCRHRNVEGVWPSDDSEAGTEASRNTIWQMIYNQRAECRGERRRLVLSLDTDLRQLNRLNRRNRLGRVSRGHSEWLADVFDRDIDTMIFSGFAI